MAATALSLGKDDFGESQDRQRLREHVTLALGIGVLVVYPFIDELFDLQRMGSAGPILVYAILAMGLNIVVGYAGLLDLGYAAFFAIGAYTIGLLTSPASYFVQQGWIPRPLQHFWPALAVSWIAAAVFGVLLGAPTLRLRGDYLAIVTLGFGEIVPNFFLNADKFTGGTRGISQIDFPGSNRNGYDIFGHQVRFAATDQRNWYWLILAIGLLSFFMIRRFYDSRLGRTWMAMREDEIAAASMGVNLVRTKLWAFAMGASFAGFAGTIYAANYQYVHPSSFEFSVSVTVLAMIILGGLGNIYGAVAGALLIGIFDRVASEELNKPMHWLGDKTGIGFLQGHDLTSDKFLVFGLALIVMMLWRPEGLFPSARRKAELAPESETERVHETQTLYEIRGQDQPGVGERA